jgi:hypothetical protein
MMAIDAMDALVRELESRGLSKAVAERYAVLIGDVIEEDENGKWIVRDESGVLIDRIDPIE